MSIEELKAEIRSLSGDERHELSSFLVKLDLDEDAGYWERIRRRTNDDRTSSWINVEDLAKD